MVMTSLVNMGRAQISRDTAGTIKVDDPESPLVVRVRAEKEGPTRITEITVSVRHPTGRISAACLARLPLAQIRNVAAALTAGYPNDIMWQTRVTPKSSKSWGPEHWAEVRDVYAWAVDTNRPGGGAQAISDIWGVSKNPTAYRWMRKAGIPRGWKTR